MSHSHLESNSNNSYSNDNNDNNDNNDDAEVNSILKNEVEEINTRYNEVKNNSLRETPILNIRHSPSPKIFHQENIATLCAAPTPEIFKNAYEVPITKIIDQEVINNSKIIQKRIQTPPSPYGLKKKYPESRSVETSPIRISPSRDINSAVFRRSPQMRIAAPSPQQLHMGNKKSLTSNILHNEINEIREVNEINKGSNSQNFILKISGIWETQTNYGLTYKIIKPLLFILES